MDLGRYADEELADEPDRRPVAALFSAVRARRIPLSAAPLLQGLMRLLAPEQSVPKLLHDLHDDERDCHAQRVGEEAVQTAACGTARRLPFAVESLILTSGAENFFINLNGCFGIRLVPLEALIGKRAVLSQAAAFGEGPGFFNRKVCLNEAGINVLVLIAELQAVHHRPGCFPCFCLIVMEKTAAAELVACRRAGELAAALWRLHFIK